MIGELFGGYVSSPKSISQIKNDLRNVLQPELYNIVENLCDTIEKQNMKIVRLEEQLKDLKESIQHIQYHFNR